MIKKSISYAIAAIATLSVAAAFADDRQEKPYDPAAKAEKTEPMAGKQMKPGARMSYRQVIAGWDKRPREVAQQIVAKYGPPHGVTDSMLVWHDTKPFKRTIVYREAIEHDFPKRHLDVVEQFIDYKVPVDMVDEIVTYDGSVVINRTAGEMSARCDNEAMNLLALNLAHQVATGEKTVEDARQAFSDTAASYMKGQRPAMTQKLAFAIPENTRDPDEPVQPREQQARR